MSTDKSQELPAFVNAPSRSEPITDLASMMVSHMQDFQRFNKAPPEKIIFYRDGVSEG